MRPWFNACTVLTAINRVIRSGANIGQGVINDVIRSGAGIGQGVINDAPTRLM